MTANTDYCSQRTEMLHQQHLCSINISTLTQVSVALSQTRASTNSFHFLTKSVHNIHPIIWLHIELFTVSLNKYKQIRLHKISPSLESKSSSASQYISCILLHPEVQYLVYKSPPSAPTLKQTNQFHALPHYFLKIHFSIVLPSTSMSSKWSFPSSLSTETLYASLLSSTTAARPAHLILLHLTAQIIGPYA